MADNLTKSQRSNCMSKIRSKWTKQEVKFHNYLKGYKIKHVMHPRIPGNPDVFIKDANTAVFLHGCFWHKCPKCFKLPKSNLDYWIPKINKNVERDKKNVIRLRKAGVRVCVIWEHEFKMLTADRIKEIIKFVSSSHFKP